MQEEAYKIIEKGNTVEIHSVIPNTIKLVGVGMLTANSTFMFILYAGGLFAKSMEMFALGSFILVISPGLLFASMFFLTKRVGIDISRQLIIFKRKSIDIYNIAALRIEPALDSKKRPTYALNIIERGGDIHLLAKAGQPNLTQLAQLIKRYTNIDLEINSPA